VKGRPPVVKRANPSIAPGALIPRAETTKTARSPNNWNSLLNAATEFDVDAPSICGQPNQSRPLERDRRQLLQLFLERPHAMEGVHVKGLKVFHRLVPAHFRKLFDAVFGPFRNLILHEPAWRV